MTLDASSLVQSSATSYTIHYNSAETLIQKTVKASTQLSADALKTLQGGLGSFTDRYGTHFVAGYVMGKFVPDLVSHGVFLSRHQGEFQ